MNEYLAFDVLDYPATADYTKIPNLRYSLACTQPKAAMLWFHNLFNILLNIKLTGYTQLHCL